MNTLHPACFCLMLSAVLYGSLGATNVTLTWVQGPNKVGQLAVYGAVGVYDAAYTPRGRFSHCSGYSDNSRLLYMFGGATYAGRLNDIWSFDTVKSQWALLAGSPTLLDEISVRGTIGVQNALNSPSGLSNPGCGLAPTDNHFYLFGGMGFTTSPDFYAYSNDLWRFNVTSLQWTLLSGDGGTTQCSAPTLRVESDTALPCGRYEMAFVVHPTLPIIFIHGGQGPDISGGYGRHSDLWQYNIIKHQWSWLSGSLSCDDAGNYGTFNTPSPNNVPPSRSLHQMVFDTTAGNLIMFGGFSADFSALADMWTFSFSSTLLWTWVGGSRLTDLPPVYGPNGNFSSLYTIGGRYQFSMALRSGKQQLIFTAGCTAGSVERNDVWIYLKQWAFAGVTKITTAKGSYGTRNQTSATTYFGARDSHSMNCYMSRDVCIMFGGEGLDSVNTAGSLSDVWRIDFKDSSTVATTLAASTTISSSSTKMSTAVATLTLAAVSQALETTSSLASAQTSVSTKVSSLSTSVVVSATNIASESTRATQLDASFSSSPTSVAGATTKDAIAENKATFETTYVSYIGIFILGAVILAVITTAACCMVRRTKNNTFKHKAETAMSNSDSSSTMLTFDSQQMTDMTTSMTKYTGTTMMSDAKEFSMPGFLECHAGTDFRWEQKIAEGGGGEVYIGRGFIPMLMRHNGGTIIVKIVTTSSSKNNSRRAFNQEVAVMNYLSGHRNIALVLGWCSEPLALLMKYYQYGTLSSILKQGHINNKAKRMTCSLDIANGLKFMHSKGVAHCDIKPDNVLVDVDSNGQFVCVLTDFGITGIYSEELNLVHAFNAINLKGVTIIYAAPEAIRRFRLRNGEVKKQDAFRGDVFSAAMVYYTLLNLQEPWSNVF